jgi:hypothetical protein
MSTSFGVLVFLLLLGFTVQFMFHLHARSVVRSELYAATSDAVALASDRGCAVAAANLESQFPSRLGAMGELSTIDAVCGAGFLRAHVRVDPPSAIPSFFGEVGFLGSIERTVEIRLEELQ